MDDIEEEFRRFEKEQPLVIKELKGEDFICWFKNCSERNEQQLTKFINCLFNHLDNRKCVDNIIQILSKEQTVSSIHCLRLIIQCDYIYDRFDVVHLFGTIFSFKAISNEEIMNEIGVETDKDKYRNSVLEIISILNIKSTKLLEELSKMCYDSHLKGGLMVFLRVLINHKQNPILFPVQNPLTPISTSILFHSLLNALKYFDTEPIHIDSLLDIPQTVLEIPPKPINSSLVLLGSSNPKLVSPKDMSFDFKSYLKGIKFENRSLETYLLHLYYFFHYCYLPELQFFHSRSISLFSKSTTKIPSSFFSLFIYDLSHHILPIHLSSFQFILFYLSSLPLNPSTFLIYKDLVQLILILLHHSFLMSEATLASFNENISNIFKQLIDNFEEIPAYLKDLTIMLLTQFLPLSSIITSNQIIDISSFLPQPVQKYLFQMCPSVYSSSFHMLRFIVPMPFYRVTGTSLPLAIFQSVGSFLSSTFLPFKPQFLLTLFTSTQDCLMTCLSHLDLSRYFIDNFTKSTETIDFIFWLIEEGDLTDDMLLLIHTIIDNLIMLLQNVGDMNEFREPFKTKFERVVVLCIIELETIVRRVVGDVLLEDSQKGILCLYIELIQWDSLEICKFFVCSVGINEPLWLNWKTNNEFFDSTSNLNQIKEIQQTVEVLLS